MLKGTYIGEKKDKTPLYRASITYKNKHISLGSFKDEKTAHKAYMEAHRLINSKKEALKLFETYDENKHFLSFDKWVCLINARDNKIYIKTPIYLEKRSFLYYFNKNLHYRFDVDDLFYYSNHKIMKRGSHLFVADYGSQISILSRYGIKSHAVPGRDYRFVNGDPTDLRYGNIDILNKYSGVVKGKRSGKDIYTAKLHINGDVIIGHYKTEEEAAIAVNKAADILWKKGFDIEWNTNFVDSLNEIEYASLYNKVRISSSINELEPCKTVRG